MKVDLSYVLDRDDQARDVLPAKQHRRDAHRMKWLHIAIKKMSLK